MKLIIIACILILTDAFQITLYGPKNVKSKKMFIASYCQKIPKEISANLRYVHTNNNCVLLWEDEHCKINSLSIVTNPNEVMPALDFEDMFNSISDCSKTGQGEYKKSVKAKNNLDTQNYDYNPGEDEMIEQANENEDISKQIKNKIKDELSKSFGWFKNKFDDKIDKIGK